jgi:hypothetical protein
MHTDAEISFVEQLCLPFLRTAQNSDGGWGFHPGSLSRVEPTCWAVQALASAEAREPAESESVARGFGFLHAEQLPDGSWPSAPGEPSGGWVTSLACCVLGAAGEADPIERVTTGLNWLCRDWPRDSSPWRRLLARFSSQREIFPINNSYRGWGWTPGTSSWVEPTAFALLALERAGRKVSASLVTKRRRLAIALLYDRMCPGGGWNCGNPAVYGVPGEPLVVPTAFALLALRNESQRSEITESLKWLEAQIEKIQAPGSLAVARLCLTGYGRTSTANAPEFRSLLARTEFPNNVQVMAWICMAISTKYDGHRNSTLPWLFRSPRPDCNPRAGNFTGGLSS